MTSDRSVPSTPHDRTGTVSAVVCTKDAVASIAACLQSLRDAGVDELIVVDARSTDGTAEIVRELADVVLEDEGVGLGAARNLGIAHSTGAYILNVGSDNVMSEEAVRRMVETLESGGYAGVSATTRVLGEDYLSSSINDWWTTRFRPGPAAVIGTPSLFRGDTLRAHPYDASRMSSDDSELCERWARDLGARFAISDAVVLEVGKSTWTEVRSRCRLYGISDYEVFAAGSRDGWSMSRRAISLLHPLRKDLVEPLSRLDVQAMPARLPFFAAFTTLRYAAWAQRALRGGG
jgi:glycosyltransferase involved in cell wall biosynthesis